MRSGDSALSGADEAGAGLPGYAVAYVDGRLVTGAKCFDLVMMFVIFRLVAFEQGNKALSRGLLRDNDGLSPLNKALFLLGGLPLLSQWLTFKLLGIPNI